MNGFDGDQLICDLVKATTPAGRFGILTAGLAKLGLDTINYGYFDAGSIEHGADIQFLTTMSNDWMQYYFDRNLAETDSHVVRVRDRKITPYIWNDSTIQRVESQGERSTALQAAEAGLRSALCVPLVSPYDPFTPVGGITLGASLSEADFKAVVSEHGATLTSIAYLFHNSCIRQLWHERKGGISLSPRERDCLRYIAHGKRQDAIAHLMGVARVTVEMHLRAARLKLHAQTLNEAIAKALVLGEIMQD
jgi:DNA-binding CsgD family transcriptional regulator